MNCLRPSTGESAQIVITPKVVSTAMATTARLRKSAVITRDTPGFVVNRLLFPYLFSAVDYMQQHQLEPKVVDSCMRMGAGHPMGPIALLDEKTPVVCVATDSPVLEKVVSNMQEVRARGAHVIAVATEGNREIGEHA